MDRAVRAALTTQFAEARTGLPRKIEFFSCRATGILGADLGALPAISPPSKGSRLSGDSRATNQPRVVVYTAIFGGYEGLIPQRRLPGVDFVCFTDGDVSARPWRTVRVPAETGDATRDARRYKILAHEFLPDYDISIWMDANYLLVGDVEELLALALSANNIGVFDHNQTELDPRDCVYDEFAAIMKLHNDNDAYKDCPDTMLAQMERYRAARYPKKNGLAFSAALVRRHHAPDVVRTMNRWWEELAKGSRRDQLSFDYAAWTEGLEFTVLPGDLRDSKWFYMLGAHRQNYRGKLLRYRLRKLLGLRRR